MISSLEDTSLVVETLCSVSVALYRCNMLNTDDTPDCSLVQHELVRWLAEHYTPLSSVDKCLAQYTEFSDCGSGPRERGFVMEYIREIYGQYQPKEEPYAGNFY